ncbi:MAG: hypothetical protein ACREBW_02925 [Candidatus Micrarchaeaceae archaeon]
MKTFVRYGSLSVGVYFYKPTKKWRADLCIPGKKKIRLGYFTTKIQAEDAVDAKIRELRLDRLTNADLRRREQDEIDKSSTPEYANEQWVILPDYPQFEFSNLRRVRMTKTKVFVFPSLSTPVVGYAQLHIKGDNIYLHIEAAKAFIPNPHGMPEVDHKDNQRWDWKVSNLKWVTHGQNMKNSLKSKQYNGRPTTSVFKGVTWSKKNCKWHAQIAVDGKHISGGYFDDEEEAARRYDELALLHHKEFARTNVSLGLLEPLENAMEV